ncbi:U8 snoRNA-decapping enzyme isoform X1 [Procambarus clarkii]|uniref:U8 snoRNA-decapping enzyme isoform X1 n=1 Tax=Procambarus clarkii TaxID=6728 RepID=UPI001E670E0C|nr:U8 snoRNA-decapping enzyme-like [Procambarus clarkii]XP_045582451.1 U8 snoRNA-decapping enzyme-like [Procambarus clarkii]XP_045582452.1 U8 snoRNA-decapping enzyme-like [Procambarus clarkii]
MSNSNINGKISLDNLPVPQIPKCLQIRTVTKGLMSYAEAKKFDSYRQAAHACVWARQEGSSSFGELRAAVMMHLRFDGTFGFPGGLVKSGEDVVDGLNREMAEEIGWSLTEHPVTWSDYYNTQVEHNKHLVLHFFIKEVTLDQFITLEKKCPTVPEYGDEVLGTVRVPLYTMQNMYSGLPAFLNNRFVGTAKQQLLLAMHYVNIMTEQEINDVMYKSNNLKLSSNRI